MMFFFWLIKFKIKHLILTFYGPCYSFHAGAGVAGLDSQLYAIGGYDGTQHLNSTESYSACADQWRTLKDMNSKRCYVGECVLYVSISDFSGPKI